MPWSPGCSRLRPSTSSSQTLSFFIFTTSGSAGSATRRRSRKSTSRRTCSAGACSDWAATGAAASGDALLACLPGEQHELGLIAFGLALRSRSWRIAYLGAETPLKTLENSSVALEADLIALSAVATDRVEPLAKGLRRLGQTQTVAVGGLGASAAAGWRVVMLPGDTVAAAEHAGALLRRPSAR